MTQVIPTLLATTEEKYKEDLDKVKSCPELAKDWVQIDLMDNKFVPNLSIGPDIIAKYNIFDKTEAHMMVAEPKKWFEGLKKIGFKRVLFPIEVGKSLVLINEAKSLGFEVGLTINPPTDINLILEFIDKIAVILIMGVMPGFQGQTIVGSIYDRIKEVATYKQNNHFLIEVDGGISWENARQLADSGADILAVGSKLFEGQIGQNLEKFKAVLKA